MAQNTSVFNGEQSLSILSDIIETSSRKPVVFGKDGLPVEEILPTDKPSILKRIFKR